MNKTLSQKQLDLFQERCHDRGLRITPQRIAIYEELCRSSNHPTAEQVYSQVRRRFSTISLNTVNDTLLTFSKIGLVDIVVGFGGPRRYDPNLETHHHINCIKCGSILDFYSPPLDKLEIPQKIKREYEVLNLTVVLSGVCSKCRTTDS